MYGHDVQTLKFVFVVSLSNPKGIEPIRDILLFK